MVASCKDPLGMPSFSVLDMSFLLSTRSHRREREGEIRKKTRPLTRVADIAVAESRDQQQKRVVVTVDQDAINLQAVAGRLTLGPQLIARAAEERRKPGIDGAIERVLVHEADHQYFSR